MNKEELIKEVFERLTTFPRDLDECLGYVIMLPFENESASCMSESILEMDTETKLGMLYVFMLKIGISMNDLKDDLADTTRKMLDDFLGELRY